jgi:hypothetical protein
MILAMRLFVALLAITLSCSVFAETKKKNKAKSKEKPKAEKMHSPREELLELSPEDGGDIVKNSALPAAPVLDSADPTYYYWQAARGRFAIRPFGEATYFKTKGTIITGTPGGYQYDIKGQAYRVGAEIEYGMFNYFSFGIGASYLASVTDEDVSTFTGFEDIPLFAKGLLPMTNFTLHYGIRMSFSPGDQINDGMGNRNAFSGGNTYGPYVGFSRKLESGAAGVDISYVYKDTRITSKDQTGTPVNYKTNIEGGHVLNIFGFYERTMGKMMMGGAVGYSGESQFTFKNNTSTSNQDGETNLLGKLYFPFKSGTMEIVPSLQAQTFLDDQLGTRLIDSKWQATARVDVRF